MLSTEHGVRQAYKVVECGRATNPLWEIDQHGKPATDSDGNLVALTNERLRSTYGGKKPSRTPQPAQPPRSTAGAHSNTAWL